MATTTDVYQRLGEVINNWQAFVDQQREWLGGPDAISDSNLTDKGKRELTDSVGNSALLETPAELVRKVDEEIAKVSDSLTVANEARDIANEANTTSNAAKSKADSVIADVDERVTLAESHKDAAALSELNAAGHESASSDYANTANTHRQGAEAAQLAAETALSATEGARDITLTYRDTAESHKNTANTHRLAAETAQSLSETAQSKSELAQSKSELAQVASESARDLSVQAKLGSESARDLSETYRDTALSYKNDAATSASEAESSRLASETARDTALSHKNAAAASAAASESSRLASESALEQTTQEADRAAAAAAAADAIVGKALIWKGAWDASLGNFPTPTMSPETADYYRISESGTMTGDQGSLTVDKGDSLYWDTFNDIWFKIDNTDQVTSVNGKLGAVVLSKADVGLGSVPNLSASDEYLTSGTNLATRKAIFDAYTDLNLSKLDVGANAVSASKWLSSRTLTLSGDVSGSVSFDGSSNVSMTVSVSDDSHNHTIANIDNLQTTLNGKLGVNDNAVSSSKLLTPRSITLGGDLSGSASFDGSSNITISASVANDSHDHTKIHGVDTRAASVVPNSLNDKSVTMQFTNLDKPSGLSGWYSALSVKGWSDNYQAWQLLGGSNTSLDNELYFRAGVSTSWTTTQRIYMDDYHPLADKLSSARTITLSGDLSGSASFDGSANITITASVADDSHAHVIGNIDGLQTALNGKLGKTEKAASAATVDPATSTKFGGIKVEWDGTTLNIVTA